MGIFKKANNIYITVRDTYTSISGSSYEEAEEVIIEATNGDLELVSQKKVIMQGLGNNSDTQETEEQREEEKVINAPCVVHFRPKKGWKGKDYGFDWMRLGEDGESPYQDIVGKMFKKDGSEPTASDINNTDLQLRIGKDGSRTPEDIEMFENLEKIYGVYEVPFEYRIGKEKATHTKYYPSWLSVYPNKKIQLQLKIFIKEKSPNALLCFQENENFKITPKQINISNKEGALKDKIITIECIKPFDEDQTLYIRQISKEEDKVDNTKPLAGVLRVWRNAPKFQKQVEKVLFVNVDIEEEIPIKIKDSIKVSSTKDLFNFLGQALIKVNTEIMDLSLKEIPLSNVEDNGFVKLRIIGNYSNNVPTGFRSIESICLEKLKDSKKYKEEYNNYIKIFCFYNRLGGYFFNGNLESKDGYTNGNTVVLFSKPTGEVSSHELLHALGLEHSFNNKELYEDRVIQKSGEIKIITFSIAKTDNIMDYSKNDEKEEKEKFFTLSKWQWELLYNLLAN
ncbi:hypothetical protein [Capnocytophaga gingivalis]|jgi:hypothetical protein|uniref:hypothetical protein n=1 Tax=Capnocytophaga gingivalis TaxID=1017 RepID=UPI0028D41351|nr:hypothetical protein [Capnocytophaga gingivalis]